MSRFIPMFGYLGIWIGAWRVPLKMVLVLVDGHKCRVLHERIPLGVGGGVLAT